MGIQLTCDRCGKVVDNSTGYYEIEEISYHAPEKTSARFIGRKKTVPAKEDESWCYLTLIFCRTCWPEVGLDKYYEKEK